MPQLEWWQDAGVPIDGAMARYILQLKATSSKEPEQILTDLFDQQIGEKALKTRRGDLEVVNCARRLLDLPQQQKAL